MNSQAHQTLKKIQAGEYAHQTLGGVQPTGYTFTDGSSIVRDASLGWKVEKCVSQCSCIAGLEAYGEAAIRHRTGLVSFS